jgi:hypothetical protein
LANGSTDLRIGQKISTECASATSAHAVAMHSSR